MVVEYSNPIVGLFNGRHGGGLILRKAIYEVSNAKAIITGSREQDTYQVFHHLFHVQIAVLAETQDTYSGKSS